MVFAGLNIETGDFETGSPVSNDTFGRVNLLQRETFFFYAITIKDSKSCFFFLAKMRLLRYNEISLLACLTGGKKANIK